MWLLKILRKYNLGIKKEMIMMRKCYLCDKVQKIFTQADQQQFGPAETEVKNERETLVSGVGAQGLYCG